MTMCDATLGPHLELKPLSLKPINAKLLHQRDGGGLQHVHLQVTQTLKLFNMSSGFNMKKRNKHQDKSF